jgi:hypothetical protein
MAQNHQPMMASTRAQRRSAWNISKPDTGRPDRKIIRWRNYNSALQITTHGLESRPCSVQCTLCVDLHDNDVAPVGTWFCFAVHVDASLHHHTECLFAVTDLSSSASDCQQTASMLARVNMPRAGRLVSQLCTAT